MLRTRCVVVGEAAPISLGGMPGNVRAYYLRGKEMELLDDGLCLSFVLYKS